MRLMKALIPLFGVLAAGPLLACPATTGTDINPDFVQAFIKAGEKLGAPCPATYKENAPGDVQIEYLPEGQAPGGWKQMMTVNLTTVDSGPDGSRLSGEFIEDATATFIKRIKGMGGTVTPVTTGKHDFGKMYVMRYVIGEGAAAENALAVIRPVGPDKIAVIHWQKHGDGFDTAATRLFGKVNGIAISAADARAGHAVPEAAAPKPDAKAAVAPEEKKSEEKSAEKKDAAAEAESAVTPPPEKETAPGKILKTKAKEQE